MLSPLLVGPILRYKCLDAQCISNTTRVCLKALEKHSFLLQGKGQGKGGGKGYGGGPGQDRRVRSIEEVAEDMLRTLEELKAQQRGGQSLSGSQQEGAAAGHV